MTEILYRWLDEELRISVSRNADDFLKEFGNGQMLGKILNVEGVLPDKKFDQLRTNDLYEDRLHNFLVVGPYMKMLGVNLSVRQARDILSDKPGSLTYLIYQVYLALHRPREHLRLRSPEPLPEAYKQRLNEVARPDLRDSGITSLALTCQCYGQQVAQTRLAEAHYVKECQQRITREAEDKKELANHIQQQMTDEYMKGDSALLWGRAFASSVKPTWKRDKDRERAEAADVRQQMKAFDADAENRMKKYDDVRNAQFLQTTVTDDMIPDDLVNTKANQQFIHKLRCQLDRDTKARFDREKRRKQMYLALRDEQRRLEQEHRELDLVRRLLRQGDYELRLAAHLADIKRQKQIIVQNRLEKDQQMQERRQDEYERSIQQQMQLLSQKRVEHQDELQKEAQLHRRLLQERRGDKQERRRRVAEEVVEFCMDIAVLTVDYKAKSGDAEVPAAMWNDWRQLFMKGENLSNGSEPEELSATSALSDNQQKLLQQQDLADYMSVVGEWVITDHDSAKSRRSAQARDETALQMESSVVTGFVVHRLLRLVYPPKQPIDAPDRPNFSLMAVVTGKSYSGKTQCLNSIENCLGIYHIEVHELVRRSLAALEEDNRLQLEAAGSSIMETLKIADILPDFSTDKVPAAGSEAQMEEHAGADTAPKVDDATGEGDTATADNPQQGEAVLSGGNSATADLKASGSRVNRSSQSVKVEKSTSQKVKAESSSSQKVKSEGSSSQLRKTQTSADSPVKAIENKSKSTVEGTESPKVEATTSASAEKQKPSEATVDPSKLDEERLEMQGGNTPTEIGDGVETVTGEGSEEASDSVAVSVVSFQYSRFAQLGREVKAALESGQRVTDATLAALVLEALRELPEHSGWIIEGFPNTIEQAQLLEEQLVGKTYDSDEEMDEIEIEVRPLPKPVPPVEEKGKGKKKDKAKKDKKDKKAKGKDKEPTTPPPPETPPPPPPPPEPVYTRVKPFRRSRLVPDREQHERSPGVSGLDLVVELTVSDEVAQRRRCLLHDDVEGQPDSANYPATGEEHVQLAGKLFSYRELRQPLETFYRERGVFRQVDAEIPLEEVDEQLVELIQVSQEQKEAARQVEEQRRALLDAAENAPDSEPEPEPEPEPESEKTRKPKGGKKPAKAKNKSGESTPAEKKGKAGKKGKKEQPPEPTEPAGPSIPAPPPMPTPGEPGYYFVDAPVPPDVASYLALMWQQMEHSYIGGLQQWLGKLRQERAAVVHHLSAIRTSFNAFLLRPDHKQQFLDRYTAEYNQLNAALLCDEEVKCEWHLRIQELESTIWNITDTRRCEAEQERFACMTSGWIEDRLALSANNWLMVMQAEMDRFQDTSLVLEDYFISMSGSQLPDSEGRPRGFKQGMIDVPSREPLDRSGASSAGSEGRHSGGSRSSSSARPLRRAAPAAGRAAAASGSGVLSTITVPQLRPRLQFQRGKNQSDELTTAVEGVIDSACKAMLAYGHDCRDKGEGRVRSALQQSSDESKAGKAGKKAVAAKGKGNGKGRAAASAEDGAAAAVEAAKAERCERALSEYQAAAREETARVAARLALVRARAVSELQAARQRAVAAFQLMWSAIGERYGREVTAAAHMADYLRSAVERQQQLHYDLLLDQDRFLVRTGVLTHLPCLPASPRPSLEPLQADSFSLPQVDLLWRQLHRAAPSGTVTTRALCFMLQDLVVCGTGTQELPELWMSLTQTEIEGLSARIAYGAEVLSWRGMIYDLMEPWPRPDQYELHEAVLMAHVFDKERTGLITRDQAVEVVHWIKPRQDPSGDSERSHHKKRLLIAVSGAPNSDTVHYPSMLTWLSRSDNVLQSFLCALTVLEEKPVFITNPEDDTFYYRLSQVDLDRIQSLPNQGPTSPPVPDHRPRCLRDTQSGPVHLAKDEPSQPDVLLKVTRSDIYQHDSVAPFNRQDSLAVGVGGMKSLLPPPGSAPPVASESSDSSAARVTRSVSDVTSSGETVPPVQLDLMAEPPVLAEITIPAPAGHTVDSWTELAPSCCTHPPEAPSTTPSLTSTPGPRDTGNQTTLNSVRTVLVNSLVLPIELMPAALERLDLDLALVHRDLYGGSCCETVEALRTSQTLQVPILGVFHHPAIHRYLGGQCTLLSGRPWQIIKHLRSEVEEPPHTPHEGAAEDVPSGGPSAAAATTP